MTIKDRMRQRLEAARKFTEGLLATFRTPSDWKHRPHAKSNAALWIVGHLTLVDNSALRMFGSPEADERDWAKLFGPGSEPPADYAGYPGHEDVLAHYRQSRQHLLAALDAMEITRLLEPVPPGAPAIFTDIGSVFELLVFHEGMHAGQLTVCRQSLGHPRLIVF